MQQPRPELTPGKRCLHRCSGDYQHLKGFISKQGKQPPKRGMRQRLGPQAPAWWELPALLVLSADGEGRFFTFLAAAVALGKGVCHKRGEEGCKAGATQDSWGPVDSGGPPHTAPAQAGVGTTPGPRSPSHCQPEAQLIQGLR